MSIQHFSQDIVAKVNSVAEFDGRVGLAVGGKQHDPTNQQITMPAAWVIYTGDDLIAGSQMNPQVQNYTCNFVVKILVNYADETSLSTVELPLLHKVAKVVQGSEPTNYPGFVWSYDGQGLESLDPDRMVWQQQYSIKLPL